MKRFVAILFTALLFVALMAGCEKKEEGGVAYVEGGMPIATTTGDFADYAKDLKTRIDYLSESGFRYIDLSLYNTSDMDPFLRDNWKEYAQEIKQYAAEKGLTFVQAHAFGGSPFGNEQDYATAVKMVNRGLEVCQVLEIPHIVLHPGDSKDMEKEEFYAKNKDFFSEFIPMMEQTGVNILIENSSKSLRDRYCMDTAEELLEFLERMDHPQLKICWDTGHANLEQISQYDQIVALGDKLAGIHISDNLGEDDNHMMPYQGTVNFDEIMCALVKIGYKGAFTFECDSNLIYGKSWLNSRNDYKDSFKLYSPPVEIKIEMEKTMLKIGEYFLTQYEIPIG